MSFSLGLNNVHLISFHRYYALLLDLIPNSNRSFGETVCGLIEIRHSLRLKGLPNEKTLLIAGGMADAVSKGQKAGRLLVGGSDDMLRCQNHRLKKVYEEGTSQATTLDPTTGSDVGYQIDFDVLAKLFNFVSGNAEAAAGLTNYQIVYELDALLVKLFNDTRWEGRYKVLKRAVR